MGVAAARVERRIRLAAVAADLPAFPGRESAADFGEIFRHELNNELTGILGNAELLLSRRDRLPSDAVERLRTIAQLAVRVRETVRRLSHAWDLWQRQPRVSLSALLAPRRRASRPRRHRHRRHRLFRQRPLRAQPARRSYEPVEE